MKKIKLSYIVLAATLLAASCNSLDQYPSDKFTEGNYWTSEDKALSVLNMAYKQMFNADTYFSNEALTDNMYQRRTHDERVISSGLANASNARFESEWKSCYSGIKTCHVFLENVGRVSNMSAEMKQRTSAEARFIRAWLFFRLTTWYGDVPLFKQDISLAESKVIKRNAHSDVIDFICSELDEIAEVLPASYDASDRGRITSGAAIALKARVYLYENDWDNVAATCERLMNSSKYGKYALYPDFAKLFTVEGEYSCEDILSIQYVTSLRTWDYYQDLMPPSMNGRVSKMAPTQELVDDFIMLNGKTIGESGSGYNASNPYVSRDPRLDMTIVRHLGTFPGPDGSPVVIYTKPGTAPDATMAVDEYNVSDEKTSPTGYYLKKNYDYTAINSKTSGMNLMMIRWADVLLMYAESKIQKNEMNSDIWDATIGAVRKRAGFSDPSATDFNGALSQSELRDIVRRERRCEFANEGLRIFDIRRWKTAETVLNGASHGAMFANGNTAQIVLESRSFDPERDYLWAIPQSERDINKNLTQNPNY